MICCAALHVLIGVHRCTDVEFNSAKMFQEQVGRSMPGLLIVTCGETFLHQKLSPTAQDLVELNY
jgi:hypothetical protein